LRSRFAAVVAVVVVAVVFRVAVAVGEGKVAVVRQKVTGRATHAAC
jgi:hypothetical protein